MGKHLGSLTLPVHLPAPSSRHYIEHKTASLSPHHQGGKKQRWSFSQSGERPKTNTEKAINTAGIIRRQPGWGWK